MPDGKPNELPNLPDNIRSVQPGERGLFRLERWFGRVRRDYLRRFRPAYVQRMAADRRGECVDCPHDVIDARDLKLYRNVCGFSFDPTADRFAWRDRLPFARQGLVEVTVIGGGGIVLAILFGSFVAPWLALPPAMVAGFYLWFFRDPDRATPSDGKLLVAPCDGLVDDICDVAHCADLGGPATRIGISLSLFDVHLNRAPIEAEVQAVRYHAGVFRNAQRKGDHSNNEQFWTVLRPIRGGDPVAVRQIAGPLARTIVNEVRPGQQLARGQRFGMIKFGSRTELYIPRGSAYRIVAEPGTRVRGGVSALLEQVDTRTAPTSHTTWAATPTS